MKELQNFVYRHMDALKHHKRYLAMLTALSMLVTFIVPLILVEPADSMTGILVCNKTVHTHNAECYVGDTLICDIEEHIHTGACYKKISTVSLKGEGNTNGTITEHNVAVPNAGGGQNEDGSYTSGNAHEIADGTGWYNPAELPLYTLLFGTGENHWVKPELSLEQNLEIVDDEYFLGFASDFCAFIESDFTATDTDAEGRIFIGGDLTFKNDWNYQVGAGDYGQFKSIWNTDEYGQLKGFASGIIGGKVYRLATMTTGAYSSLSHDTSGITHRHVDKKQNDVFLYPEEGAYKRFIVGNLNASLHYDEDYKTRGDGEKIDLPYEKSCNHLYYDQGCTICDTSDKHDYLGEVNELSQFYLYDDVSTILERTFDTLRARSLSLASVQAIDATIDSNGTLSLDASDIGDAKTVYFKINKWENVKRVVITVPDDRITYTETGDKEEKYSNNNKTIKNLDLNIIITCGDEEIKITQNVPTFILAKTANEKPDGDDSGYYGYKISNRGTDDGGNATNNHPVSSNILYNFYNAAKVTFTGDTNFNGTIFAPNASVTAPDACRGHLSGALIAKSFKGGLEFGYRPYRGGVDIFGMASGYAIPVNKFGDDGETALPGALFAIKQDGKFVSLFESGYGTNFAALPSKVDFTGNTPYKPEEVGEGSSERPYVGQEIAGEKLTAPVDFTLYTDRNCSNGIVDNSNILPKFYLDANQALNIDANENFKCVEVDTEKHIYEIQLIKPVTSLTITGRNPGESTEVKEATVKFNPMTLKVNNANNNECFVGDSVGLTVDTAPQGDGITYKYFLNGSQIDYNDSYQLNTAGGATFSVGAYVNIDGQEYEIANATAEKVNVKDVDLADLSLKLYRKVGVDDNNNPIYEIVSNNAITSGEELQLRVEGETGNATIKYAFYDSDLLGNNTFGTYGIVGKDLIVKAEITVNGNTKTLQDTVTVNFGTDIKFNDYNTTYDVNPYSNLDFYLENIEKYLNQVPNDKKTITFYFKDEPIQSENFNSAKIDQKLVGENMSVYAVITANGLEHTVYGNSVTGKYSDNLSLYVESGAFIVGNNIHMNVSNAPVEAEVIFEAVDSKGVTQWTDTQTAYNGTCSAVFPTEVAGDYTIKASIKYENNTPKVLVHPNTITVSPKPVNGNLSVNPSEVYAGNAVELKIYGATIGADVVFTIIEPNGNPSYPKGQIDQSGEYTNTFTPTLSGEHTIKAVISKDGASISLETSLTVKENTSTLNGNLSISSGGVNNPQTVNPGDQVTVNVTNATNGAVLNLTITGPDGKVEPDSVTISNGTYNYEFTPEKVGTYTVTGKLTSGTQERELEKVVFKIMGDITIEAKDENNQSITQFTRGEYVTLSLTEKPDEAVRVDYYLDSLNSSTVMKDISDLQCRDTDEFTVTFKPAQTGIHKYRANAIDANGNVIATVTQEFETVEPAYDVEFKFYNSDDSEITGKVYNAGETVTLRIYGLSKQINNVQGNIPGVAGLSLEKGEETDEYTDYKFVVPNNTCTDEDLVITINLNQGSPIQLLSKITILDPASVTSLSLRKYLSILAEENLSDNEIEIDVPQGYERISNLKIAFLGDIYEKQSTFKLQAEFTHSGETTTTTQYYDNTNVSGQNPYYLDIPSEHLANNVTKIVITPLEGSITVDKIYPTYVKNENTLEKTSATGFTLIKKDVKVIPVEDWVLALDSITFNLEIKKNTNIWYALIEEGKENEAPAFSEVEVQNADSISISNLNAENIAQIMVYTEDESLTVKDYTISGFIGDTTYSKEELENLKNNNLDVINYYTLVEQQAPVGYFKEDTIYTIEVKETIKLDKLAGTRPKVVETKVTVRDKDGNEKLTYTVEIDDSENKRTIKIPGDATFEITNSEVKCTEGNVDTSTWDTTKPGYYNDKYYFDPNAMMVVPVSDKPIEYTNKMGLLFRKVEKSGAIVKGVEISLVPDKGKNGKSLWYWDENTSEWLIDYTNLVDEKVYKFTETYGGSKYELADDIYFQKTGEKQITYWIGSEFKPADKTNENQLTVLNLSESFESRVIRMENIRVVGIKPTLKKTDMDGNIIDGSAKFALYAADGTELLNPIDVVNGKVDFYFDPQKIYDAKYVEDGYLKPGSYYLQELNAPDHYEAATRSFGFEIVKNDDDVYSIIPSNPGMGETIGDIAWSTPTKPDYTIDELTFYYADGTFKKNSKEVEVTGNTYWYTLDYVGAGLDPKNVVGIKLKVGGNGTEDKKFMIRHSGNKKGDEIWGETKDSTNGDYTNVKPRDEYYTFGDVPEDDSQIVVDPKPTIDVGSKNTILISNKPLSDTMNLRVDKKWVGDAGITELRKPVEVQLMQKLGDGDYKNYDPPIESAETTDNGTEAVPADSTEETPTSGKVILNAANNWSYVWENLPRYVNGKDDAEGLCYYKINEVTAIDGYTTSIIGTDINNGGTIIIKNTAETMDIPVEKKWTWDADKYNPTIPRTVKLKLQINVGEESAPNWKDVPGKTLVLTGDGDTWQGKFTGLIKGYQYQVVEADVPFGWVPDCGKEVTAPSENAESFDGKFTVTNTYSIPEGSLAVQKLWDEMGGTLPHSITVDLYRSVIAPSYTETDAPWTDENSEKADADKKDYKTDYARLLQHSLYFYDANMCGTDVAAKSALAWRTNCHTEDEIPGGYHDAGDHVMFGLPQGYAASMLGWTYYEFIKGNISDTEEGKVPSQEANHFKVILERFYDFFANSVRYDENGDISEILVQKGGGNIDHSYWGAPEKQVTRETEMFWSNYGADIASEYAAALALGYLNFKDSDSEKYEKYLKVAKDLFEFAEKNPSAYNEWGVNKDETQKSVKYPGFYDSQSHNDDMALAAGWLHLADPNGGYKDKFDAIGKNDDKWFSWNDVSLAAYAVGAYIGSNSWSTFADKINEKIDEDNPEKYFFQDGWGSARYNAIMQTAALVAAKHDQNKEKYKSWAQGQMNMLLGDNDWNDKINGVCDGGTVSNTNSPICLVTNFVPDGFTTDTPQAPHHRAASGWDSLEEYKVNCGYDDDSYALIGAMVGGPSFGSHDDGKQQQMYDYAHDHPLAEHSYIDDLHDYCCNEVSIDYNAGLVGAAAGLYYFYKSGDFSNKIEGVEYGAYGLDPYVESDIDFNNAQNNPLVDEDINAAVLKSFAMKQTKVRIMAESEDILLTKNVDNNVNYPNATKITLTFSSSTTMSGFNYDMFINGVQKAWNAWSGNGATSSTVIHDLDLINLTTIKINPNSNAPSDLRISAVITYSGATEPPSEETTTPTTPSEPTETTPTTSTPTQPSKPVINGNTELFEGETITLTADKSVNWSISSNDGAAQIDNNGRLFAKNVDGETWITVKATDSSNQSNYSEKQIKIKAYQISGDNGNEMNTDATKNLTINGSDFSWSGNNISVESQNGNSCTVKAGSSATSATVTASKTVKDLNNNDYTINATYNIEIKSSGSGSTTGGSITFENTVSQLYNGGSFTFTVSQTGDVEDVKWSVTGNDKVEIDEDNGELTIAHDANSGNITVTATPYNSNGEALTSISHTVYIQKMTINNLGDQIKMGQTVHSVQLQNKPDSGSFTWSAEPSDMLNIVSPNNDQTNIIGLNKEDEVVVIATVTDNGNVIAVAKKTVKVEKPTFSFKNEIGSMMVGGNAKLEINNTDNVSNITTKWSSSKPAVASVDEHGNVNAKGEGEAVITATIYTKINNIDYEVGKLTQTINVTEYLPDPPGEDYKLITSYAYPEGSNTVQKDKDLKLKLDSILAGHPVDAVIVEFEKANFNGIVYWDKASLDKGEEDKNVKFKYDSCDSFTIKFNEVGYTDGQTVPGEFAIRYWWAQNGSITVKKVYFYAKTLIPKIINAPSELAVGDKYTLKAIALSGAASWTSSDPTIATIDPATGEITAKNTGNVTFTANGEVSGEVSVEIPIKRKLEFIDENENPVEISKIRNNVTAKLSISGEGVEYEITEGGDIITIDGKTGILTPIAGKTGTVEFKAIYAGENESNTVTLTVVDALKIIGENQQMPVGTKQQLTVENAIGDVEWSIKSGKTDIIEITENGLVKAKAYGQETVVVRDSDGATVEFIIDAIVKPLLPKDTENVKRVEFTAQNAIIKDVVDGTLEPESGFETTNHEDWTVKLENLPLCDEKGNPYYYYIEETMYKKTSSSLDETLDPKNANGYYVLSSDTKYVPIGYNAQGSVPTEKNYPTLRVGNMATEKVEGQLPSTGGSGVTTYYYLGGVIMLLSIAGFTGLKRRERKRRKE